MTNNHRSRKEINTQQPREANREHINYRSTKLTLVPNKTVHRFDSN